MRIASEGCYVVRTLHPSPDNDDSDDDNDDGDDEIR